MKHTYYNQSTCDPSGHQHCYIKKDSSIWIPLILVSYLISFHIATLGNFLNLKLSDFP